MGTLSRGGTELHDAARNLLAYQDVADEPEMLKRLEEGQVAQLDAGRKKAQR
jgi:hypothetical protein